jgi:hypothetical protein
MEMARLTSVLGEIISGNNIGAGGTLELGRRMRVGPMSDEQEWHACIGQTSSLPLSLYYYLNNINRAEERAKKRP